MRQSLKHELHVAWVGRIVEHPRELRAPVLEAALDGEYAAVWVMLDTFYNDPAQFARELMQDTHHSVSLEGVF